MAVIIKQTGSVIALFAYAGKTMIGRVYNINDSTKWSSVFEEGSVIGTLVGNSGSKVASEHYVIDNPCEVEFGIERPLTGSAQLTWKLKPYFYKKLLRTTPSGIHFIFPKSQVCLSNVTENDMDEKLINAYKELVQLSK